MTATTTPAQSGDHGDHSDHGDHGDHGPALTQGAPSARGTQLAGIRHKVFLDRYARKGEDGTPLEEYPEQMWRRVAAGIAAVEPTPAKVAEWTDKFDGLLSDFKFVPGGRILSGAGTGHQVTYYNCFSGDTLVHTREGIMRIGALNGVHDVLSQDGVYRPATFRSYGVQDLWEVVLENGTVLRATAGHEWVIKEPHGQRARVTTRELAGRSIPVNPRPKPERNEDFHRGVQHGIIYGDGTTQYGKAHVDLFGEKMGLAARFEDDYPTHAVGATAAVAEHVRVSNLPVVYKALPLADASPSYWRGFVVGLIATDGHVDNRGSAAIYGSDADQLYAISYGMAQAGFVPSSIRMTREFSPYSGERKPVYRLAIYRSSIVAEDVIKESHALNWAGAPYPKPALIKVESVRPLGSAEEVFCCDEPETHTLTVGHGYLTGNCYVVGLGEDPLDPAAPARPQLSPAAARPAFFDALTQMTDIMSRSGGVGMNLSSLPPRGTVIAAEGRGRTGPVRPTVALDLCHPDASRLLDEKDGPNLAHVDVAVIVPASFDQALAEDGAWTPRWNDRAGETVRARDLWARVTSEEGRPVGILRPDAEMLRIADSRDAIVAGAAEVAQRLYRGEGTIVDFTPLRPKGAYIKTVNGTSSGPVAWMYLIDAVAQLDDGASAGEKGVIWFGEIASTITGKTIQQGGSRRGALMVMLDDDHPDIEEFIKAKRIDPVTNRPVMIEHANMSVCASDAFMAAVKADLPWDLKWQGTVVRTVRARHLWDLICTAAWTTAEPGLVFMERAQREANTWYYENIRCVNPCGEQPLPAGGVCNLGALNLERYVDDHGALLEDDLARDAAYATRFLDDVIDATPYFSDLHIAMQREGTRRTGLGTMGLADALIKMEVAYGSPASEEAIDRIYRVIRDASYRASVELAREKGPFGKFDKDKYLQGWFIKRLPEDVREGIGEHGIRNGVLLTQAPTGTTSLLAGVSSGIEPVFDFAMKRVDRTGEHILYHPLYEKWREGHPGEERPDFFVGAKDLTPEEHVVVQAKVQEYTDSSISKTANAPHDHTMEEVKRLYIQAYDLGCKGVTYYRDGSRDAVLTSVSESPRKATEADVTPDDGAVAPAVAPPVLEAAAQPVAAARPLAVAESVPAPAPAAALFPAAEPLGGAGLDVPEWVLDGKLKRRPNEMAGFTRNVSAPEGKVNITINSDADGPLELFINVGRAGSDVAALAEALGRLVSLQLRLPSTMSQEERLRQAANQLRGIGGSRSIGFGPNRVLSLPDAVAQAIYRHLEEHPTPEEQTEHVPAAQLALPVAEASVAAPLAHTHAPHTSQGSAPSVAQATPATQTQAVNSNGNGNGYGHVVEARASLALGTAAPVAVATPVAVLTGNLCPQCGSSGAYVFEEGCKKCHYCGYSEC